MKHETIGENAEYMDDDSLEALEALDDTAWPILCVAAKFIDSEEPGMDTEIALTHESLDDFDASRQSHWSEKGEREEIQIGDVVGRAYNSIQTRRGERRCSLLVLDFGPRRVTMIKW